MIIVQLKMIVTSKHLAKWHAHLQTFFEGGFKMKFKQMIDGIGLEVLLEVFEKQLPPYNEAVAKRIEEKFIALNENCNPELWNLYQLNKSQIVEHTLRFACQQIETVKSYLRWEVITE